MSFHGRLTWSASFSGQNQHSQPSSLTSSQSYQPDTVSSLPSQQSYAPQQQQQQQSAYPTHYSSYQTPKASQPQSQAGQYPNQGVPQQGYYPTDQSSYQGQPVADRQSDMSMSGGGQPGPGSQYEQGSAMYTSQGYNPPTSSYPTHSQPYPQAPPDPNSYSQVGSQNYGPGQQTQAASQNPYARSMSPRQAYPQPSKGYNYYFQSQGQQPGYPPQ